MARSTMAVELVASTRRMKVKMARWSMLAVGVDKRKETKTANGKAPAPQTAPSGCEGRVDEEAPQPQGDEAMKQWQAGDRAKKGVAR